ncbi:hypothetical protein Xcaj_18830, partial [Xanthomonas axonopodis pv. cajani]
MIEPRLRSHVLPSRSAHAASRGAFAALSGVQMVEHPADQLIGLACAFRFTAEECGYDPLSLIELTERMEVDCRFRGNPPTS